MPWTCGNLACEKQIVDFWCIAEHFYLMLGNVGKLSGSSWNQPLQPPSTGEVGWCQGNKGPFTKEEGWCERRGHLQLVEMPDVRAKSRGQELTPRPPLWTHWPLFGQFPCLLLCLSSQLVSTTVNAEEAIHSVCSLTSLRSVLVVNPPFIFFHGLMLLSLADWHSTGLLILLTLKDDTYFSLILYLVLCCFLTQHPLLYSQLLAISDLLLDHNPVFLTGCYSFCIAILTSGVK